MRRCILQNRNVQVRFLSHLPLSPLISSGLQALHCKPFALLWTLFALTSALTQLNTLIPLLSFACPQRRGLTRDLIN